MCAEMLSYFGWGQNEFAISASKTIPQDPLLFSISSATGGENDLVLVADLAKRAVLWCTCNSRDYEDSPLFQITNVCYTQTCSYFSCDLDLDPMTLLYECDLAILKLYLHIKNELF